MDKRQRDLYRAIEKAGYTILDIKQNNHIRLTLRSPTGVTFKIWASCSPRDSKHYINNTMRNIKCSVQNAANRASEEP